MLTSKGFSKASASILILFFIVGLLVGGLLIYFVGYRQVSILNGQISNLQSQVADLRGFQNATTQNITIRLNRSYHKHSQYQGTPSGKRFRIRSHHFRSIKKNTPNLITRIARVKFFYPVKS